MGRLSPEEILEKLEEEEQEATGKLKIFLGYCAGVGKTYHMLDIAKDEKEAGKDVVIGYVEKHDRKETLALLEGMEILPTKQIEYKKIILQEVDVEAILRRKPEVVIVDEYAHTNVHGSKNEKRYQDIQEILANGIDVYTTLNIQHIESLNELVKKITNVKVKEIVPDKYVRKADNIELIDIEPKELLYRIYTGKVYKKEKVQSAIQNFFTLENLIKLREISLRYMMDWVDRKSVSMDTKEKILVLIEEGVQEEGFISKAYKLANDLHTKWEVICFYQEKEDIRQDEKRQRKKQEIQEMGGTIKEVSETFSKKWLQQYLEEQGYHKLLVSKQFATKRIFRFYWLIKKINSVEIYFL